MVFANVNVSLSYELRRRRKKLVQQSIGEEVIVLRRIEPELPERKLDCYGA